MHRSKPPGPPDDGDGPGNSKSYWALRKAEQRSRLEDEERFRLRRLEGRRTRYLWEAPFVDDSAEGMRRLTPFGFRRQDLGRRQLELARVRLARPLPPDVTQLLDQMCPLLRLHRSARFDLLSPPEQQTYSVSAAVCFYPLLRRLLNSTDRATRDDARLALLHLRGGPNYPLEQPRDFVVRLFQTIAQVWHFRSGVPGDVRITFDRLATFGDTIGMRVYGSLEKGRQQSRRVVEACRCSPSRNLHDIAAELTGRRYRRTHSLYRAMWDWFPVSVIWTSWADALAALGDYDGDRRCRHERL